MKNWVLLMGVSMAALLFSGCSLLEDCADEDPYDESYTRSMQTTDRPSPQSQEMPPLSDYPEEECPRDDPYEQRYESLVAR